MIKKTAYVTGGLGLIGNSVCAKFQSEGYECVALDLCETEYEISQAKNMRAEFFDVSDVSSLKEKINSFCMTFRDMISLQTHLVTCSR